MATSVQPILCCMGDEVAGEPTQFLMERAFTASRLDWRVITVEVPVDDVEVALAGARVMNFSALRLFGKYPQILLNALPIEDEVLQFVGCITSAQRNGPNWDAWHHSGYGMVDLLAPIAIPSKTVVWVTENRPESRSLLAAIKDWSPKHLFWNAPNDLVVPSGLSTLPLERIPNDAGPELVSRVAEELASAGDEATLLVVGSMDTRRTELLKLVQPESSCQLIMTSDAPGSRRKMGELWKCGSSTILSRADWAVASEAYDFRRWTKLAPSVEALRDAYDEYTDF